MKMSFAKAWAGATNGGWFREDRLAYLSIIFTLIMGAVTAYALTRVDYLSGDIDLLVWLVAIDALALVGLGALVGRQVWRLWRERRQRELVRQTRATCSRRGPCRARTRPRLQAVENESRASFRLLCMPH